LSVLVRIGKLALFVQLLRPRLPAPSDPARPEIGFVFPTPLPRPIRRNSLSAQHLPSISPRPKLALFDARDKSRGAIEFAINRYFLYIYALFWFDKPSAGIIL
jgi:hypothetical protein